MSNILEFQEILLNNLHFIQAFAAFFLFLYFFNKLSKSKSFKQEFLPFLGIILVFLFLSINSVILYWLHFYPSHLLRTASMGFVFGSFLSFLFFMEYCLKKTRGFVTLYGVILLTVYLIYELIFSEGAFSLVQEVVGIVAALPPIIFLFIFSYLALVKPTSGYLRIRMYIALLGLFLITLGSLITTNLFGGLWLQFIWGSIIQTFGICLIGYGYAAFSTFTDFNWKEKLRELFVISQNGICLYAFSFEKKIPLDDSDLITSGFSGIQLLLSEMVKTQEHLQLIDYQNVKIMVEQGEAAMFVLIIKEESSFLQHKLRLFSEEFQTFFKDILRHWTGEIDVFIPTKTLIQRIFEIETS